MDSSTHIRDIYKAIKSSKAKYGVYRKTLFHLHTPASYDFHLLSNWKVDDFRKCSEEKIVSECYKQGVLPKAFARENLISGGELAKTYDSKKEWLSYLLVAGKLFQNKYEVVLISDHNSLKGFDKLQRAVEDYYNAFHKGNKDAVYPELINGVEVSCADKFHVVGIFDKESREAVEQWLNENVMSEELGTFKTSLEVIQFFRSKGGFAYIAHIKSADFLNQKKTFGAAYKQKLIDAGCFDLVGVRETSQIDSVKTLLKKHGVDECEFILDNDSHTVDEIPGNYFWLKAGKRKYAAIKEALDDYYVSVSLEQENGARRYIYGVYIEYEEEGFLSGKDGKGDFNLRLSDALNCFIGGRGTGKSTVLQILDYALGQRVANEDLLNFLCRNGNVWVLYILDGQEYLVNINLPCSGLDENVLRYFGQNEEGSYGYRYHFNENDVRKYALKNHLTVYKVTVKGKKVEFHKVTQKRKLLGEMYDTHYSVNRLVQTASSDEINIFIRDLMFRDKELSSVDKSIRARRKSGLIRDVENIEQILQKRSEEVHEVIDPFNEKQKDTMRIEYSQDRIPDSDPDFAQWMFGGKYSSRKTFKQFSISQGNVIEYLDYIYRNEKTIFDFLRITIDPEKCRKRYSISEFLDKKDPESDLIDDEKSIIAAIVHDFIRDDNVGMVIQYLKDIVSQIEEFRLLFNINSSTTSGRKVVYKNVKNVSLGQKVVAMLNFVLGYGTYIGDKRPLIIDQPEDNLDSQYIYFNLVQQLRDVKQERQVIIATHNATIVTNAMTDQVCVMRSDGEHGWVEQAGYPSEARIKKDIINYLEGGIESFRHKEKIYQPVL